MKKTIFSSIKFKISFYITIMLIVTASLFALLLLDTTNDQVLNSVLKRAEAISSSIAAIAPYSILSGDRLGTDNLGWKVKEANRDVEYVVITDSRGKVLSHTDVSKVGAKFVHPAARSVKGSKDGVELFEIREGGSGFLIQQNMFFGKRHLGNVFVGLNKSLLIEARREIMKRAMIGLFFAILLGIGCVFVLSSLIVKPITELSKGVDQLTMGKRSKLQVYADDELGSLTDSFNKMTELTTRQQAQLRMYSQELEESYVSTVKVLTAAIDARDPYTLGHSTRVAKLSLKMGEAIGLPRQELEDLEIASLFHDVGKLKTPDYVLLKDGPLDCEEKREIASHCEYGAAILSRATSLHKYIPAVRHHHEWFNGEGYPDGLRGEDIPLHASIIAIADAFDAMTSIRPYKKPFSLDDALFELVRFSGRQFNPWLVDIFQTMLQADPLLAEQFSGRG